MAAKEAGGSKYGKPAAVWQVFAQLSERGGECLTVSQFFVFDVAWWFFCFFGRAIPRLVQCDGQVGSRVSLVRLLTPRHVSGACASGQNSTFGRGTINRTYSILITILIRMVYKKY